MDELAPLDQAAAGETEAVTASDHPATSRTLNRDLRALGVADGLTLLVHTSM